MLNRLGISLCFLLALSCIANCAKRQVYDSLFQSGFVYCNGPIGNFNVVLTRVPAQASGENMYQLDIQPLDVPQAGSLIHIAIANSNQQYRDLIPSTQIVRGQTLSAGSFSRDDINLYPYLVMVPFNGNSDPTFLNNSASTGVFCHLPSADSQTGQPL